MFRGYQLRLPSLFGREKARPATTNAATAQRAPIRQSSARSMPQQFQRNGSAMTPMPNPSLSRGSAAVSSTANAMPDGQRAYGGQPIHAVHSAMANQIGLRSTSPAAQIVEPTPTQMMEQAGSMGQTAVRAAANDSPAEKLAAQAHEWSATAQSESEFTRIIETCRRARASQPNQHVAYYVSELTAWALNRRGQLKADSGRTREALLDFDDAIRADPKCWRAAHNRGVLVAQAGQFEKAFDDFTSTIETNPDFAKAYSNRGALLVVAGKLNAALADYGRAVELDPNLAIAHRGRGRVCHLLGRLDEAIGHYDCTGRCLRHCQSRGFAHRSGALRRRQRRLQSCHRS
jgi:lipoprotein NlpI